LVHKFCGPSLREQWGDADPVCSKRSSIVNNRGSDAKLTVVYKILAQADWEEARRIGHYLGSRDDLRDGFIHLSAAHQLAGTAARHFRGIADLVLVALDAGQLGSALKWEPSRGG